MIEIVDQDQGWADLEKSVQGLDSKEVLVGYSGSTGDFGVTDLAIVHEFGTRIKVTDKMRGFLGSQGLHLKKSTTHITIPPRSFMRSSFDNNTDEVAKEGAQLLVKVLDGSININLAYEAWGDSLRSTIKQDVISRKLGLTPNSEFTKERKGSDTPLIDTGRMINAMDVKVEEK